MSAEDPVNLISPPSSPKEAQVRIKEEEAAAADGANGNAGGAAWSKVHDEKVAESLRASLLNLICTKRLPNWDVETAWQQLKVHFPVETFNSGAYAFKHLYDNDLSVLLGIAKTNVEQAEQAELEAGASAGNAAGKEEVDDQAALISRLERENGELHKALEEKDKEIEQAKKLTQEKDAKMTMIGSILGGGFYGGAAGVAYAYADGGASSAGAGGASSSAASAGAGPPPPPPPPGVQSSNTDADRIQNMTRWAWASYQKMKQQGNTVTMRQLREIVKGDQVKAQADHKAYEDLLEKKDAKKAISKHVRQMLGETDDDSDSAPVSANAKKAAARDAEKAAAGDAAGAAGGKKRKRCGNCGSDEHLVRKCETPCTRCNELTDPAHGPRQCKKAKNPE